MNININISQIQSRIYEVNSKMALVRKDRPGQKRGFLAFPCVRGKKPVIDRGPSPGTVLCDPRAISAADC